MVGNNNIFSKNLRKIGPKVGDEWPFIAYPNDDYSNGDFSGIFEENMTICIESYVGEVGGHEGVKLENQYLITKSGLKLLTKNSLDST